MKINSLVLAVLAAASFVCAPSFAADNAGTGYLLGSINASNLAAQSLPGGVGLNGHTRGGYGIGGGYHATNQFSVEVAIQDGYDAEASMGDATKTASVRDLSLSAIYLVPLTPISKKLSLYGKAGVAHTVVGAGFGEVRATRPLVGIGAQVDATNQFALRLGYDYIDRFAGQEQGLGRVALTGMYSF